MSYCHCQLAVYPKPAVWGFVVPVKFAIRKAGISSHVLPPPPRRGRARAADVTAVFATGGGSAGLATTTTSCLGAPGNLGTLTQTLTAPENPNLNTDLTKNLLELKMEDLGRRKSFFETFKTISAKINFSLSFFFHFNMRDLQHEHEIIHVRRRDYTLQL